LGHKLITYEVFITLDVRSMGICQLNYWHLLYTHTRYWIKTRRPSYRQFEFWMLHPHRRKLMPLLFVHIALCLWHWTKDVKKNLLHILKVISIKKTRLTGDCTWH